MRGNRCGRALRLHQYPTAGNTLARVITDQQGPFQVVVGPLVLQRRPKLDNAPGELGYGHRIPLGRQVRQAFYGDEAQRIQRGRDDVRVMVRYPEAERRSIGDLEAMRIRTPDGREVPFSEVAVVEQGRGYSSITRVDPLTGRIETAVMYSGTPEGVDFDIVRGEGYIIDMQTAVPSYSPP